MTNNMDTKNSRWTGIFSVLPEQDWVVVGWTIATKLLLAVVGVQTYQILTNQRMTGPHNWLEIWNRWDSLHYLKLAEFGYSSTDPMKAWLYPLFPWTVRVFAWVTRDYLVAAFVVSGLACAAAAVLLRRLIALDYGQAVAQRAVWFFLIFPTAYFLHIGYTESLFLAFMLASLLGARNECWWMAGVFGALCWMTRPTGIILLPTLAIEAAHRFWETRRWQWQWLWIAFVPVGFGVYLLLNLQDRRQRLRIPAYAKTAFLSLRRVAMGRNGRCLAQPTSDAIQRDHGWHGGIPLRLPGAVRRDRELYQIEADLRRLDNRKLVTCNISHVPGQRASLCADPLPDLYVGRSRRTESILVRNHDGSVASFSRSFRRTFRPRLVGFLIRIASQS